MNDAKKGIACGGQWIIDRVKSIDHYPKECSVAMISEEKWSGGGCAYNVIVNLAKFDPELPLAAVGLIGDDAEGDWIISNCKQYPNISPDLLIRTGAAKTSYTDVYSARAGGSRTFFHYAGANALFSPDSVPLDKLDVSMFHLGYLAIMDGLDAPDAEFGRKSARLLHDLKTRGISTSVDLISSDRPDYCEIVDPALKYTDYLIINDFETEQLSGSPVRENNIIKKDLLLKSAEIIMKKGVNEFLVIHFPEGALFQPREGELIFQPSLLLPDDFIVGSTGAGDSFCAAVLYGLYHEWSLQETARFAVCAGAQNLRDLTSTGAITPWRDILALYNAYPKNNLSGEEL